MWRQQAVEGSVVWSSSSGEMGSGNAKATKRCDTDQCGIEGGGEGKGTRKKGERESEKEETSTTGEG